MKKRNLFAGLCFALMGTMVLLNNLDNPRIQAAGLHVPDILRFVASGGLFAVALVLLFGARMFKNN
jgi:hypothetical protein